uniref:Uncharacterized protein n=1 Tax=Strongyloides papillosus TaxID=174720 RepID=A0A0N5C745_STREA
MGVKDNFVNMLGEFVQMNKCPELRSKSDVSECEREKLTTDGFRSRSSTNEGISNETNPYRRHSIQIHVGAEGPPESMVRHRTYSVNSSSARETHIDKDLKEAAKAARKNKRYSMGTIETNKSGSFKDLNKTTQTYRLFNKPRPKSLVLSGDEDEVFEKSSAEPKNVIKEEDDDQTYGDCIKIDRNTNVVTIITH